MKNFKEIWENQRYKALIKLACWFIFFLLIFLFCSFSSEPTKVKKEGKVNEQETTFLDFEAMKSNLLTQSYDYTYNVTNEIDKTLEVYNGKIVEGVDNGYYESKTVVYKYSCTLEKCYKEFTDHKEEFDINNYPLKYILSVFELIKEVNPIIVNEDDKKIYKYSIVDQDNTIEVKIVTSSVDIININEVTSNITYDLNLSK